jgi:hypothetical protein
VRPILDIESAMNRMQGRRKKEEGRRKKECKLMFGIR